MMNTYTISEELLDYLADKIADMLSKKITAPEVPAQEQSRKFVPQTSDGRSFSGEHCYKPEMQVQDNSTTFRELLEVCKPAIEFINKNYDPHCQIIVSPESIKLLRDEIGIPIKND